MYNKQVIEDYFNTNELKEENFQEIKELLKQVYNYNISTHWSMSKEEAESLIDEALLIAIRTYNKSSKFTSKFTTYFINIIHNTLYPSYKELAAKHIGVYITPITDLSTNENYDEVQEQLYNKIHSCDSYKALEYNSLFNKVVPTLHGKEKRIFTELLQFIKDNGYEDVKNFAKKNNYTHMEVRTSLKKLKESTILKEEIKNGY